jgi:hypothetical protein
VEPDVGAEVDGGAWSSLCGSGADNSLTGRLHTKLTPLACLLEHPSWRLAGSVEAARSEKGRGGEFYQQGVGERE